jgi:phosphopantothenoylcysteine synthetase/decarboxylase
MRVLLGVTGSIAAYKAADVARRLTTAGHEVDVVLTAAATRFIAPLTFATLTGRPAHTDQFDPARPLAHIDLARDADLALVAPATANHIAKLAAGLGDDLLSTALLAWRGQPRLIAPAMNTAMYDNPATQRNLATLVGWGWQVIEPAEGLLACGDVGRGALAPVDDIVAAALSALDGVKPT